MKSLVGRFGSLHVADHRLSTVPDVNVLDPHVLRTSVLALPKCLGGVAEGVYQPGGGMCECLDTTITTATASKPRQQHHAGSMCTGHLHCDRRVDFVLGLLAFKQSQSPVVARTNQTACQNC